MSSTSESARLLCCSVDTDECQGIEFFKLCDRCYERSDAFWFTNRDCCARCTIRFRLRKRIVYPRVVYLDVKPRTESSPITLRDQAETVRREMQERSAKDMVKRRKYKRGSITQEMKDDYKALAKLVAHQLAYEKALNSIITQSHWKETHDLLTVTEVLDRFVKALKSLIPPQPAAEIDLLDVSKDAAMKMLIMMEQTEGKINVEINQYVSTPVKLEMLAFSNKISSLIRQLKVMVNNIPDSVIDADYALLNLDALKLKMDGCVQEMDTVAAVATNLLVGAAGQLITKGIGSIGQKTTSSVDKQHDKPAIPKATAGNMAVADLPVEVSSVGFQLGDFMGDYGDNFSQDPAIDIHDIVARCQIPSRLDVMEWSTSDVVGAELIMKNWATDHEGQVACFVAPWQTRSSQYVTIGPTNLSDTRETALSFFQRFYSFWRGDIVFELEALTTQFHQGMLWFCYQPGHIITSPTLSQSRNCMGVSLDLSLCNKTKLTIPYNSIHDYMRTKQRDWKGDLHDDSLMMGAIYIWVQTPLVAPPTVAQSIDLNLWVSAGENFELIAPTYFYPGVNWNGVFPGPPPPTVEVKGQQQMELAVNLKSETIANETPEGHIPRTVTGVCVVNNVEESTLENIAGRPYLLATGLEWTTTFPTGTAIFAANLASLFGPSVLSIRGLCDYHAYIRTDFEVTIRMNSNPFMTGLLVLTYIPAAEVCTTSEWWRREATFKQTACAFLSPSMETSMTIRIPWTNIHRILPISTFLTPTDNNDYGRVVCYVYNPLRSGAGGVTKLNGSVMGRLIDPYIGFKRANTNVADTIDVSRFANQQMDAKTSGPHEAQTSGPNSGETRPENKPTDSATGDSCSVDMAPSLVGGRPRGYVRTTHSNVLQLMKRPDYTFTRDWVDQYNRTVTYSIDVTLVKMGIGKFVDCRNHNPLYLTYQAWSGSHRLKMMTNNAMSQRITYYTSMAYNEVIGMPESTYEVVKSSGDAAPGDYYVLMSGLEYWKPIEGVHTVQIPYFGNTASKYCGTELISNPYHQEDYVYGGLKIGAVWNGEWNLEGSGSTNPDMTLRIFHEVGDDFKFYGMKPIPNTYTRFPAASTDIKTTLEESAKNVSGWVRDLLREGIEANPGPYDLNALDELTEEEERILDEVVEEAFSGCEQEIGNPFRGVANFFDKISAWINERMKRHVAKKVQSRMMVMQGVIMDKIIPAIVWVLDFMLNLHTILTEWNTGARLLATTSLAAKCVQAYAYGSELLDQLNEVITGVVQEADEKYEMVAGSVATVVVASLTAFMGYSLCKSDAKNVRDLTIWKVAESASCLAKVSSGCKAVPSLWDMCRTASKTAMEYFIEGDELYEHWADDNADKLRAWQEEVDECLARGAFDNNNAMKFYRGVSNFERMEKLASFAKEIRIYGGQTKGFSITRLRTAEKLLTDWADVKKAYDYMSGRLEPVGIYIEGSAGCGKSYGWTNFFPFLVMKQAGLVSSSAESKRNVYAKPSDPEHKFLDGYMSQHWVMCDDFAAGIEDKDALQMINLISVATCPVNMADIKAKTTTFDSKFICCTTNQKSAKVITSVRDSSALIRRFPVAVHMSVRRDYGASKLDMAMAKRAICATKTIQELKGVLGQIWKFEELDLSCGALRQEIGVTELVDRIVSIYTGRRDLDDHIGAHMATLEMDEEESSEDELKGIELPWFQTRSEFLQDRATPASVWKELTPRRTRIDTFNPHSGVTSDKSKVESVTRNDEAWDAISYLAAPLPKRERMEKYFEDDEVLTDTCNTLTNRLRNAYGTQVWKLVKEGEFSDRQALRFYREIVEDYKALGFQSRVDLEKRVAICTTKVSLHAVTTYAFSDTDQFISFLRSVYLYEKEGPAARVRKRWVGLMKYVAVTAGLVAGGALVYGVYRLLRYIFKKIFSYAAREEGPFYDSGGKRQPFNKTVRGRAPVTKVLGETQGEDLNPLQKAIQRSIRRIQLVREQGEPMGLYCLAIDNKTLVVPKHFVERARQTEDLVAIELEKKSREGDRLGFIPIRMDRVNVQQIYENGYLEGPRDVVVVKLVGVTCQHARNIRALVMDEHRKSQLSGSALRALWLKDGGVRSVISFKMRVLFQGLAHLGATVGVETSPGDCGYPHVIDNVSEHRPLVGFHVLGIHCREGNQVGIGDFTIESIERAEEAIMARMEADVVVEEVNFEENKIVIQPVENRFWTSNMELHGEAQMDKEELARYQPTDTMFGRTGLWHKNWEDPYAPTQKKVLRVGQELVHPLITNFQKFEHKSTAAVPVGMHFAVIDHMISKMDERNGVPLTMHEAINGVGAMKPIVMSTSSGYLQKYVAKGKKEFFEPLERTRTVDGEEFQQYKFSSTAYTKVLPGLGKTLVRHINDTETAMESCEAAVTFWVATTKDELVDRKKVETGKTRVFIQPGLEMTILFRKHFGDFLNHYKARAGFTYCHAISKDKEAIWADVFRGLKDPGGRGFDCDTKNYDGSVSETMISAFLAFTDAFYGPRNRNTRHSLINSVMRSLVIVGPLLAEKEQGNTSGNPCTDVINSITNWYLLLVAFGVNQVAAGLPLDFKVFDEQVRALTYGDDLIVGASDEVLVYFNRITFAMVARSIGVEVTDASKSGTMTADNPIEELQFLKSTFVERDGVVFSPLPKKVVYRDLMWEDKKNHGDALILEQKVEAAINMMAHHGEREVLALISELKEQGITIKHNFKGWVSDLAYKQEVALLWTGPEESSFVNDFLMMEPPESEQFPKLSEVWEVLGEQQMEQEFDPFPMQFMQHHNVELEDDRVTFDIYMPPVQWNEAFNSSDGIGDENEWRSKRCVAGLEILDRYLAPEKERLRVMQMELEQSRFFFMEAEHKKWQYLWDVAKEADIVMRRCCYRLSGQADLLRNWDLVDYVYPYEMRRSTAMFRQAQRAISKFHAACWEVGQLDCPFGRWYRHLMDPETGVQFLFPVQLSSRPVTQLDSLIEEISANPSDPWVVETYGGISGDDPEEMASYLERLGFLLRLAYDADGHDDEGSSVDYEGSSVDP